MIFNMTSEKNLIEAFRLLDRKQNVVEDSHGNISCRTGTNGFLIKPSGMGYDEITRDDLCFVVATGDSFTTIGTRRPSVDVQHHYEIYARNPHVKSICHTHSPYATALAMLGRDIPVCFTEHADYFGHEIRCLQYMNLDLWGPAIKLDDKEQAVLLGNHGALICCHDEDPRKAVKLAVALEAIAKKYVIACSISETVIQLPSTDVSLWNTRYNTVYGQK